MRVKLFFEVCVLSVGDMCGCGCGCGWVRVRVGACVLVCKGKCLSDGFTYDDEPHTDLRKKVKKVY